MRVGIYADGIGSALSGGGFTFQTSLLHALAQRTNKHSYYFFSDEQTLASAVQKIQCVRLHTMPYKGLRLCERLWANHYHGGLLNRAAKKHSIDLMWYMTPSKVFTSGIPYLYTVWDLQHRLQPFFPEVSDDGVFEAREKYFNAAISQAFRVFVGTEVGRQEVCRFYGMPEERVNVIPMPVPGWAMDQRGDRSLDSALCASIGTSGHTLPVRLPRQAWDGRDGALSVRPDGETSEARNEWRGPPPFLFYPAQFWPHKNHVVLLEALKILEHKHNILFDLVLTGSDKGNIAYIQRYVKALGLVERVKFLGFVSIEQLVKLYQTALAHVFPSFFGPDNIPPLEAFALGCPVIAAHVSGADEQLGDAALLFDPCDAEALAAQIKRLYDDQVLRQQLIERGLERVRRRTPEDYIQAVEKIIDDVEPIRRCWPGSVHV